MADNQTKEKKKFSFKEYYDNNAEFRERHIAKCKEQVTCECGCVVQKWHYARHKKQKKHIKHMEEINKNKPENIIKHVELELEKLKQIINTNKLA